MCTLEGLNPALQTRPSVLVVEDDADVLSTLCEVLELEGYIAVPAKNGLEALDALASGLRPALVLLDLMMPLMDGYEFLELAAKRHPLVTMPIVVMSAHGSLEGTPGASQVAAFLRKPFTVDTLLEMVRVHIPG